MKAIITAENFNRLIAATKGFISADDNRWLLRQIHIIFNKSENTATAYAVNGYMLSREIAYCEQIDESFSVYIHPPQIKAKNNTYVCVTDDGNEAKVAYDNGISFATAQREEEPFDGERFLKEARDNSPVLRIGFNPSYLIKALKSVETKGMREPVVMEFYGDRAPAILQINDNSVREILPVRLTEKETGR